MNIKRHSKIRISGKRMVLFSIIGVILLFLLLSGSKYYSWIYGKNIYNSESAETIIYIPNQSTLAEVCDLISREGILVNKNSFLWVARIKGGTVRGGRYQLVNGMSNNTVINMLRSGLQSPVQVTFNNIRTIEDLAGVISQKIEADSVELVQLLKDEDFLKQYNTDSAKVLSLFIPNTYEFYWNTDAEGFFKRMYTEYLKFWNNDRRDKAEEINLTPLEVSTLASIVDEETIKSDEKPMVAGLYLNRLKKGIRLQADPTIKFAIDNFNVSRVINKDKEVDSPYNTYKYAGLPPGPIRIPSISGIEAVLNPVKHNYLYMCAKEDFSGYHNFAKTLEQHNLNAAKYRRELNKRRIWR